MKFKGLAGGSESQNSQWLGYLTAEVVRALQTVTHEGRLKGESYFICRREKCSAVADFTYGKGDCRGINYS